MIAKLDKTKGIISIEISYDERVDFITAFDIASYHTPYDEEKFSFTYYADLLEDVVEKEIRKDL